MPILVLMNARATFLFIPDRYMDYRMWSDIPDRLAEHADVVYFDALAQVPWDSDTGQVVGLAGAMVRAGDANVAVAAGQAARFGVAIAAAGLARGLVLFHPPIPFSELPDDIDIDIDYASVDARMASFQQLADAIGGEPDRWRELLLQVAADTANAGLEPEDLERGLAMLGDHAEELLADLRAAAAPRDEPAEPDPPWLIRPWTDQLAKLRVPVTVVAGAEFLGQAVARHVAGTQIVLAGGDGGLAPAPDRARTVQALLLMLERIS